MIILYAYTIILKEKKKENALQIKLLNDNSACLYYNFKMKILLIFYMRRIKANLFIEILNIFQKLNWILDILYKFHCYHIMIYK